MEIVLGTVVDNSSLNGADGGDGVGIDGDDGSNPVNRGW